MTVADQTIQVDGLNELVRAFAKLPDEAVNTIKPVATSSAKMVMDRAKNNLIHGGHIKSRALYNALKVNKPKNTKKRSYKIFASVWFDKSGSHGVPVELGHRFSGFLWRQANTRKVEPIPFLRSAADDLKRKVENDLIQAMDDALNEFGR